MFTSKNNKKDDDEKNSNIKKRHSVGSPSSVKFSIYDKKSESNTPLNRRLFFDENDFLDDDKIIPSTPKSKKKNFEKFWSPDSPAYSAEGNILSGEVPILISHKIGLNSASLVTFDIAGSNFRLKTKRGGKLTKSQGDHVTAYRVFLEIIWAGIDNKSPKDGIVALINIAKSYLNKNDFAKLEKIKNKYLKNLEEKLISREERKNLSLLLRLLGKEKDKVADSTGNKILKKALKDKNISKLLSSNHIKKISISIKRDRLDIMSRYLIDIVTKTLAWTNQTQHMTFSKKRAEGVEKEEYVFGESAAVKALKSLDRFIFINNIKGKDKRNKMLDGFSAKFGNGRRYYINGLSTFVSGSKEVQKTLGLKLKNKNTENTKLKNIRDFLGKNIKKQHAKILQAVVKNEDDLTETIGNLMESLYDYRYTDDILNDDFNILQQTSARHIVIIFQAFKNIANLEGTLKFKEKIVDKFLGKVFKNQGWEDVIIFSKDFKNNKEKLKHFIGDTKGFLDKSFSNIVEEKKVDEVKKVRKKRKRKKRFKK